MSGNGHRQAIHFRQAPRRVVSLVPSLTESLCDLGFGAALVGVTDYCVHPAEALRDLPRVGGTKNPRVDDILALRPDLVIANQEENPPAVVEALEAAGVPVWVTFPRSVREALDVLWALVKLFRRPEAGRRLEILERSLDWARAAAPFPPRRLFCPIWFERTADGTPWWMTFNRHTYAHDLLETLGGRNVFAERERRYPLEADLGRAEPQDAGERDTRYPRVTADEIRAADPEVILLPDEPFAFDEEHRAFLMHTLADVTAVRRAQVHLVDGSLVTWHGTRLGRAIQVLAPLLGAVQPS